MKNASVVDQYSQSNTQQANKYTHIIEIIFMLSKMILATCKIRLYYNICI